MLSMHEMKKILNPSYSSKPTDDFRILDSWPEFDGEGATRNKKLKYLCYEIETVDPETGKRHRLYKALKFARVERLPKSAKQSTSFMDMQAQVLSGVHEQGYNLVTIIANMIRPVAEGLLFLYGVQGVSEDIDDAKKRADMDFNGFIGSMMGTFRVLHLREASAEEGIWLEEKMRTMKFMTAVRGIPKANTEGEDMGNKGVGGSNLNPDSQGTLEEIITAMSDYEYVIEVLATPVYLRTLMAWSTQTEKQMTEWYGQLQGTKSISFNLSLPMTYMTSTGSSQGWSKNYTDSRSISYTKGESYSTGFSENVGTSLSQSLGESFGVSKGHSVTDSTGQSYSISQGTTRGVSMGYTEGITQGQTVGRTHGITQRQTLGTTLGNTRGTSEGTSVGQSQGSSFGTSSNTSRGVSLGQNTSQNTSHSSGTSVSHGTSNSISNSTTMGQSFGQSVTNSHNISRGESTNLSHSMGTSTNDTYGSSESHSNGGSVNNGESWGSSSSSGGSSNWNHGTNSSESGSHSDGWSKSEGESHSNSWNAGIKTPVLPIQGGGGHTWGSSESRGSSGSDSTSSSSGTSDSSGGGINWSTGKNHGVNSSVGQSWSNGTGTSESHSTGNSESYSMGQGQSYSEGYGTSYGQTQNVSISNGTSVSQGTNVSTSQSSTDSYGTSTGSSYSENASNSVGQSSGTSYNVSSGRNLGSSLSSSLSQSNSQSASVSDSLSISESLSKSYSQSRSESFSESRSESIGQTQSRSIGTSESESYTQSVSNGLGKNWGQSSSIGRGQSYGESEGQSTGTSIGTTGAYTTGTSGSMGVGPSIGYNKSYQWMDQQVKDILELLEYQNERLKKALRGNGAFYTYVYIACPNMDALVTAQAAAKSTWQNTYAMVQPVQVLDLSEEEQQHLLYHFTAFSADITKENIAGVSSYKYATVLLPDECVAYTHLPRMSEGGIDTDVDDIPKFRVPGLLRGSIYMGTQLNPARYTFKNGYRTQYDYRINIDELMHGVFTGQSRSGKTVAAMRFIRELANSRRSATGKRLRIVIMDPKQDWRGIARFVEPERFRFYSMGNTHFRPINLNPCKIPYGVEPQHWIDGIINIYCRAYGLLERGKQMLSDTFYKLYDATGIFNEKESIPFGGPNTDSWKKEVSRRSGTVTFHKIYKDMEQLKNSLNGPNKRAGNDTLDAYSRLLERLSCFNRPYSIEYRLFSAENDFNDPNSIGTGMGVDELIGEDDVTVFESFGLESTFANFIFGIITSGFYKVAKGFEKGYLHPSQYETVLVIEEANKVLTGNDTAGTGGQGGMASLSGQSEFEEILDQSAGYGLFIIAITQKISMMPSSIIANCGLLFMGKLSQPEDVDLGVRMIGREPRIEDRDVVKWLPKSPTGWFLCRSNRGYDFKEAEPVLVAIEPLNNATISNNELNEILVQKEVALALRQGVA